MSPTSLFIEHRGKWAGNSYNGGRREFIPIPNGGMSYTSLLNKIELRLTKGRNRYVYEVDALIKSATSETMRMKVIDDFELDYVMNLEEISTLFITTIPINEELSHLVMHQKSLTQVPMANVTTLRDLNVANEVHNCLIDHVVDDDGKEYGSDDIDSLDNDSGDNNGDERCDSNRHDVSPLDIEDFEENPNCLRPWIIPGASFHQRFPIEELGIVDECAVDSLCEGAIFSSKDKLIAALGLYNLENHFEYATVRFSKTRYHVVCKHNNESCSFILRARALGNAWRVFVWKPHTCEKDLSYHSEPKVCSKVLAAYFVPHLMTEGIVLRPRDMMTQVLRQFGAKINYQTALSARNQAVTMTYGDAHKSFQLLPKYIYMLEQSNPGSVVELKTDEDGSFKYCFVALAACIRGFKECRPVIVVDGTHLKGKYKGVLFVAATKDANEQIFPLAYGVGDKECDASWSWFFTQLRSTFGCPDNLLIVSDQHHSIKNALDAVYPGTPHGLCVYHLQGNIKRWGDHAIAMFKQAVNAYRNSDFKDHMKNLKSFAAGAPDKVMGVHPSRWARSQCPVRRYRFLTSNAVECLNGRLRWARRLPVCTILECIRSLIGAWFVEHRTCAIDITHELTEFGEARLGRAVNLALTMNTEAILANIKYKVSSGLKHHVMDLKNKKCTCLIFDLDLIPCSHAAAAIRQTKKTAMIYVDGYYSTKSLREIYAGEVMPIPVPEDWCIPPDVCLKEVKTPPNPKQAGRPKENRMRSGSQSSRICTRCLQRGHYSSTCTATLTFSVEESEAEMPMNEVIGSKHRKQKRCGICGLGGHTRTTCRDRVIV